MGNVKYRVELFSLFDYRSIEHHLSHMEETGWRLETIGGFWKYRRCEPAKTAYEVTYLPEASAYEPLPLEKQADLADYCAAFGWELVTDLNQLQIFRNPSENPTPIETDEALRLKMIRKSMRRDFVPVHLFTLMIWGILIGLMVHLYSTVSLLDLFASTLIYTLPLLLWPFLLEIGELLCYLTWIVRSKKSIQNGGGCVGTRVLLLTKYGYCGFALLVLVDLLSYSNRLFSRAGIAVGISLFITIILLTGLRNAYMALKRDGTDRGTLIFGLLLASIFFACVQRFTDRGLANLLLPKQEEPVEYVNVYGVNYKVYQYDILLKVEDLWDTDYPNYSYKEYTNGSHFVSYYRGRQVPLKDGLDEPWIEYQIYDVKFSPLYDLCLRDFFREEETGYVYLEENSTPWKADTVWRRYWLDDDDEMHPSNTWILCKDDIVAEFEFYQKSWNGDLSDEQKTTVGEKLLNEWCS